GCRSTAPQQSTSEFYGVATEDAPKSFFAYKDFKPLRSYADAKTCGHHESGLSVLRENGSIDIYNSIPYFVAKMQGRQPKISYALQWYDIGSSRSSGGTPIIRLIKKEDYRNKYFDAGETKNNNCN